MGEVGFRVNQRQSNDSDKNHWVYESFIIVGVVKYQNHQLGHKHYILNDFGNSLYFIKQIKKKKKNKNPTTICWATNHIYVR